jgi:2-methylisocitrate lyase-like PEP mutase family enzyme
VTPDKLVTPVGPDLDQHIESLQAYADAGVDELFVQQIGPEQELFFSEWAPEVLSKFS